MDVLKNNYVKDKMSHRRCPISVNVIMFIRLILGMYSEISSNFILCCIAKLYCICLSIIGTYFHIYVVSGALPMIIFYMSIQKLAFYDATVIVCLFSNGEHFYKYLDGLYDFDAASSLKIGKFEPIISVLILATILFDIFIRIVFTTPPVFLWKWRLFLLILYLVLLLLAVYTNHMTRIMMFELLWNRMRVLRKAIEKRLDFSQNISEEEVEEHILELEKYLYLYNMLLDKLNIVGHATKLLIFLSLPSYFLYVFTIVSDKFIIQSEYSVIDSGFIIDCMMNTVLPLVPALFAELVTSEVDKIRIHLTRQLLLCSNRSLRNRISDGLKILELRPFKYTIWRIFSLNISLPLGLISLCTTYTIVIIQFSHVYG